MKTKINRLLSMLLALTMLASLMTSLTMTASAKDYPGGVILYESFTGIVGSTVNDAIKTPTNQPKDTEATTSRKRAGNDSGAGLGDYARQSGNSSTSFNATLPASYIKGADTALVADQGSNAKLTLEFDFKYEGELPTEAKTLTAVLLGNSSMSGNTSGARLNAAATAYLQSPNTITVYEKSEDAEGKPTSSAVKFTLPEGITFDQWHRYQLTVDLTDATSNGGETYSFKVDGKTVVENQPTLYATEISRLHIHTTTTYITGLDNVSVYKTTPSKPALSTAALMSKLHEINAEMETYRTKATGASQLSALETAVTAAGTMVTTAFGTYNAEGAVVNAAKTQTEVDTVLASLTAADTAMKEYIEGLGEQSYDGGLYFYEPFDGTPKTQPEGTSLSTSQLENYNPTSTAEEPEQIIEAVTDLPGSTAAMKNEANWLNTIVNFPAAYNADGHNGTSAVDAYAKEGKDAKLVIEYDVKTTGNPENAGVGTELFVMVGAKGMSNGATAREVTAAAYALNLPDSDQTTSYVTAYRKRSSSDVKTGVKFDLTKWQHHKLTVDLTSATAGLARYSLEVDGEVIVQNQQSPGHDSGSSRAYAIEELKMYTVNENINVHLANLSIYKVNEDNPSFSPAAMSKLLREVYDDMDGYEAALAANKITQEQLTKLTNAYEAGATAMRSAYETAKTDAAAAQTALDTAYTNLENAQNELADNVFYPLQSGSQIKVDYTSEDSGVKWEDCFDTEFIRNLGSRYGESKTENIFHRYYNINDAAAPIEGIRAGEDANTEKENASLILEYDLKLESYELSEASTFKISVGNATAPSGAGNAVVYNQKDIKEFIPDVTDGVWYRFRHEVNVTDAEGNFAPTVSTWVNGVLKDNKIPWANPDFTGTVVINDVTFHAAEGGLTDEDGNPEKYGLELWYDNLFAYKSNSEAAAPINDGALVAKIRELDKEYLYSEDAALKALLDTAKAAYQNEERTQTTVDDALATLNSSYTALPESKTPYRVETFAYTNSSDEKVYEAMAEGKVTGLYVSKVGKKNGATGTPVVAVYRNNVLIDIKTGTFTDDSMAIGDAQVASLETPITLPSDLSGITISGYIMDGNNIGSLKPLAEKWTEQAYNPDRQIGFYIAGTSTYADQYPLSTSYPRAGAGEAIKKWFDGTNVRVYNAALSGATTRSFKNSKTENSRNWKMIMEGGNNLENAGTEDEIGDVFPGVQPGDYVLISFILNDEDALENKGTDFATDYRANLLYFIRTVREKGGIPILNSPSPRGTYASSATTGWSGKTNLGSYPKAIQETAEKYGVQLSNVLSNWENMIETQVAEATAGKTGSDKTTAYTAAMIDINRSLYMRIDEVSYQWWTENGTKSIGSTMETNYQNGLAAGKGGYVSDQTHKNIYGADIEAQFVLTELLKSGSDLSKNINLTKHTPVHPDPERGKEGN